MQTQNQSLSNKKRELLDLFNQDNADVLHQKAEEIYSKCNELHRNRQSIRDMVIVEETWFIAVYRSIFGMGKQIDIDSACSKVVKLLCAYFANDDSFIDLAKKMGIKNPSLEKGILLAGNPGVGKTYLMNVFSQNPRQNFIVRNAKLISDKYEKDGVEMIEEYYKAKRDETIGAGFVQNLAGLCIDDCGTEDPKCYMGNKRNVIGDIIECRYASQSMGQLFHMTTNLTAAQISEYYGPRIASRLRETINVIELGGPDRRQ